MIDLPQTLASDPPSLDRLLALRAEQAEKGAALGCLAPADFENSTSWAEYFSLAGAAAAFLKRNGVGIGDRIAIWGQTSLAWTVLLAAAAHRGAALVAIHPNLGFDDLVGALKQTRPKWLFADQAARGVNMTEVASDAAQAVQLNGVTVLPGADGRIDLSAILDRSEAPPPLQGRPDLPLNIQFTSGSTGTSKAVVLSHRALLLNAALTAKATGIRAGDRIAAPLPLFHSAGLSTGLLLSIMVDARWVGFHRFQTGPVLSEIQREACTVIQGVPTMYEAMLQQMKEGNRQTPSLRTGIIGGAFLPPSLCARVTETMGLDHLGLVYGQTEFGPTISVTRAGDPPDRTFANCGPPLPGVSVRIDKSGDTDNETGTAEILVKGPTVMTEYFDDPEATNAAFSADGWLRTGDLGRLINGNIQISARLKELIIRGGENVSPFEVEEGLRPAPGVAEVCVFGVPSSHWGEEICAVVTGDSGSTVDIDAVRCFADACLPRHRRPDQYIVRQSFPLLPNGKVDRRRLQGLINGKATG